MYSLSEQFVAANAACLDTFLACANTALMSGERLATLNTHMARSLLKSSVESSKLLLEARTLDDLRSTAGQNQPILDNFAAYSRSAFEITADTMDGIGSALDRQAAELEKLVDESIDEMQKHAPQGSEPVFSFVHSLSESASGAFSRIRGVFKQIAGMMIQARAATRSEKLSVRVPKSDLQPTPPKVEPEPAEPFADAVMEKPVIEAMPEPVPEKPAVEPSIEKAEEGLETAKA